MTFKANNYSPVPTPIDDEISLVAIKDASQIVGKAIRSHSKGIQSQ